MDIKKISLVILVFFSIVFCNSISFSDSLSGNTYTEAERGKLNGIETGAEVNPSTEAELYSVLSDVDDFVQTEEINTLAELESVSNGGAYMSDINVATSEANFKAIVNLENADIKTAYEANADTNAVTDAEKTVLGNTSGTNSGDNSANTTYTIGSATQAFDAFLDDISDLTDPGGDRLLFFDDSAGFLDWLIIGSGLTLTDKTLTASGAATAWDDLTDPDSSSSNDFGVHVIKLYVDDFWIGKDNTDYIRFTDTGMSLHGAYTLTGTWTFADGDVTPTAGQLVYDNTVIGITNGAMSWHDFTEIRFLLDYTDLPTADGQFPIYDQDLDEYVNLIMSGDITMTEAGVTAIGNDKVLEPAISFTNAPTDGYIPSYNSGGTNQTWVAFPVEIGAAISDETTDLTTGTAKVTFRAPFAFTLTGVRSNVATAPTGSVLTIDINESGTTVLSTKLTIDATEETSTTAATPAVISDSAIADDAEITVDIDAIGSSTAGKGAKIWLIGTRIL